MHTHRQQLVIIHPAYQITSAAIDTPYFQLCIQYMKILFLIFFKFHYLWKSTKDIKFPGLKQNSFAYLLFFLSDFINWFISYTINDSGYNPLFTLYTLDWDMNGSS